KTASMEAVFWFAPVLAAVGIDVGVRLLARFRAIRMQLEARAELIVVVGVAIFLIHRLIGTFRFGGFSVFLKLTLIVHMYLVRHCECAAENIGLVNSKLCGRHRSIGQTTDSAGVAEAAIF
ncbi:hypothetical protein, partial [Pseudomonas fluorescens]|uniref:hypothetical protein n=1 Tax=Pseudomonas fluorescens TaxID=294 RepID=UPI001CD81034